MEAVDRAEAPARAACDGSREGQARLRYEGMHRRAFRGAVRDLYQYRDRMAAGEVEEEGTTVPAADDGGLHLDPIAPLTMMGVELTFEEEGAVPAPAPAPELASETAAPNEPIW